jgi:metallo-beta-lactamase family protein
MDIRVRFLGGAGSVTGSKYLVEIDEYKVLVDCGLFQGLKDLRLRNWDKFPIDPSEIDAVVLTHAHIDHTGYLPALCRDGYQGDIHCTIPTEDLIHILLIDSAKLQEEEADFAKEKGYSKHADPKPLYTVADAENVFHKIASHPYNESFSLNEQVKIKFSQAGHILGAASVRLIIATDQGEKHLVFSGDLGPSDNPLHFAPEPPKQADILFIESTYGGQHLKHENMETKFARILRGCDERKGCLIIPAFSLGRTQLVLYYLWKLFQLMPSRPVYIDSPMAISVTNLYKKYEGFHRLRRDENFGINLFDAPFVHYVKDQAHSNSLNNIKHNAIIISASGMVTGGRILNHLYHRLPKEQDTVLFSGFQAEGTRGRTILSGEKEVRIFGESVPVNAHIESLEGLSAHADHDELMAWATSIGSKPKMTFLVHGEAERSQALANSLGELGWNTTIPQYGEVYGLFDHV